MGDFVNHNGPWGERPAPWFKVWWQIVLPRFPSRPIFRVLSVRLGPWQWTWSWVVGYAPDPVPPMTQDEIATLRKLDETPLT